MTEEGSPPEATGKIAPQSWMAAPETVAVVGALGAGGAEVRFVGGCVRDAMLNRPVKDVDLATPAPPERVIEILRRAGIATIPTGLKHGTVTAVSGDARFEITTLRLDIETDGRHAKVAFTDDWIADARRRDFTINALSCTPAGDVFDPFGGIDDLSSGRIRFIGNARQRIEEDLLRILRFFRFQATHGRPPVDDDALAACRALAHRLDELSGERVRDELFRILMAEDPAGVVLLMRGEHVLERILPEAGEVGRLRMMTWLDTRAIRMDSVAPTELRRLAALIDTDAAGAEAVAQRLRLSNRQKVRLTDMVVPAMTVATDLDEVALRRLLHRLGADAVTDLALLDWARELALEPRQSVDRKRVWQDLLAATRAWTPVEFPLRGRDAAALGLAPGPAMGRLLDAVEAWWEEGGLSADRAACLARLEALASRRSGRP